MSMRAQSCLTLITESMPIPSRWVFTTSPNERACVARHQNGYIITARESGDGSVHTMLYRPNGSVRHMKTFSATEAHKAILLAL